MSKRNFVVLARGKRAYRVLVEDIVDVHKTISKKRPALPKFEANTDCENTELPVTNNANFMTL